MEWLLESARLEPHPAALTALALEAWQRRQRKLAANFADIALSTSPGDPWVISNCVRILVKAKKADVAGRQLRRISKMKYALPHFHAALAYALVTVGLERDALRMARRTVKQAGENVEALCDAARVFIATGRDGEARSVLNRLLELDPARHGKFALASLSVVAARRQEYEAMLRYAVQADVQFGGKDTRRLVKRCMNIVLAAIGEREATLYALEVENQRMRADHASFEASLAGYDLSEGGTNLELELKLGEGWHIEFTESIPDQARDLGKEIAALSSQEDGGTIFIGIKKDGAVIGVGDVPDESARDSWRKRIRSIATQTVQPPNPVTVYFNARDAETVVKVWVPEGTAPIYYVDGAPYIRNLDESRKATPAEVEEFVKRRSRA